MAIARAPEDEADRLDELWRLDLVGALGGPAYDDLAFLAAHAVDTPMAVITLVDEHVQWLLARHGIEDRELPRAESFCQWAIHDPDFLTIVPDASKDVRFRDLPLVAERGIRFYAAAPLVTQRGHALGTLCVMDTEPRDLDEVEEEALEALADQVVHLFTLRRLLFEREAAHLVRQRQERQLEQYRLRLEENLAELADRTVRDAMTGLYNRAALEDRLTAELAAHRRSRRGVAVLMVDLDHFKSLNDVHGHAAGDEALKAVGAILADAVRDTDMAARYGGEEFTVILTDVDGDGAAVAAERIRARIEALELPYRKVTTSIGIACAGPGCDEPRQVMSAADAALYEAKRTGRNRVVSAARADDRQASLTS